MSLRFLTAGESHGPALTAILEGMPAGLPLSASQINAELIRRQKGYGAGPRMKIETDQAIILGGVMAGLTTGAPIAMSIANSDHEKWRGRLIEPFTIPRPGHVDLAGVQKYRYPDIRPALERASARETAARVAIGAVCRLLLEQFGIHIGGYVVAIGQTVADLTAMTYSERIAQAEESDVRCPSSIASEKMHEEIRETMLARDTLGGVIEVVAVNTPPGLGSHVHWDRKLEGRIGAAILSIPAIKGVEIGPAFENARLAGTRVHDAIHVDGAQLTRPTDRSGGLEGGITTGQPLVVRAAMKPIATTLQPQQSVDLASGEPVETKYERSDFCPVPRAVPILEAMLAYVLADALIEKIGGDSLEEMRPRFASLQTNQIENLRMIAQDHIWWP